MGRRRIRVVRSRERSIVTGYFICGGELSLFKPLLLMSVLRLLAISLKEVMNSENTENRPRARSGMRRLLPKRLNSRS